MNKQEKLELKQKRKERALEHNKMLLDKYTQEISYSEVKTKVYTPETKFKKEYEYVESHPDFNIQVIDTDTVSAILDCKGEHIQALNFASYKNPGGGYMTGMMAQEEALCHNSTLFPVLSYHLLDFYDWNKKNLNKGLYLNRGLYSPDIKFFKDDSEAKQGKFVSSDVITVAAPNNSVGLRYGNFTLQENTLRLSERIKFVLDIARENCTENTTLILGAFGCGVFRQDPYQVARTFKELLGYPEYQCWKNVIFAIPGGKNLEAFKDIFGKESK